MRRRLLTVTGLVLLLLFLAAAGAAGALEWWRAKELKSVEKQTADMVRLQQEKVEWEQRERELERKLKFIQRVMEEKPAPVPAWFLGYLGDAVPEDLLLTEVHVKNTNDLWSVRLAGVAQPTTNAAPETVFSEALTLLTNNLVSGPFHLNMTHSAVGAGADEEAAEPANAPRTTNAPPPTDKSFKMRGSSDDAGDPTAAAGHSQAVSPDTFAACADAFGPGRFSLARLVELSTAGAGCPAEPAEDHGIVGAGQ
jgi:hypothetical protein